ncbi:MAG: NAD(P)H-hydrate dehydratase [Candidatus Micrarchaeaceae archaeon]
MQDLKWFASFTKSALDSKDVKAIELNAEAMGIGAAQLMENAGASVKNFVDKKFAKSKNILVLCGTGNNGGTGFVAARHLEAKHNVTVAILGSAAEIKSFGSLINLHALQKCAFINCVDFAYDKISGLIKKSDIIIDAVFGTGFHGEMPSGVKRVAAAVARSKKPVIAVDMPSGVDADGAASNGAFKVAYTITMHKPKVGLLNYKHAGIIEVAEIGIPLDAELYTGPGDLYKAAWPRARTGNKYSNGFALIIGGSPDYSGAPSLAASAAQNTLAALRVGAGYAVLVVPEALKDLARRASPNLIVKGLGASRIGEGSIESISKDLEKSTAVAIGPGIGSSADTLAFASELIKTVISMGKKLVIDADALRAVPNSGSLGPNVAITPHDGEFKSITGSEPGKALKERAAAAVKLAKRFGANVVLKGHNTIITNGTLLKINESKTSALATMGSGDVLAGIISGYAATGTDIFEACTAGVYLHSRLGDSLAVEKGLHILASDIVERIPFALKSFDVEVG